jgi:hypothetical protein
MIEAPPKQRCLDIRFGASDGGTKVRAVAPRSQAQEVGPEPGDVTLSAYGDPVPGVEAWDRLTSHESDYAGLRVGDGRTGSVVTRYVCPGQLLAPAQP